MDPAGPYGILTYVK